MKIFYHCYGSAHSSVTAANLHLANLPRDRRASIAEIIHQPLFDRTEDGQIGRPVYMGQDEWDNEVYVIGLAGGKVVVARALLDFLHLHGVPPGEVRLENALQHAGTALRVGGYTSRRLGLVSVGRPLAALGIWLKYERFVRHVDRVRAEVGPLARGTPLAPPQW